jgi:hypothetical protein
MKMIPMFCRLLLSPPAEKFLGSSGLPTTNNSSINSDIQASQSYGWLPLLSLPNNISLIKLFHLINNFFQKILNIFSMFLYSFFFLLDELLTNCAFLFDEIKQRQAMRIVSPRMILDMTSVDETSVGCIS